MALPRTSDGTLRSSAFAIDGRRQCLIGPSGELKLRPKSFAVLRYLAQNPGRAVGKDELLDAVWTGLTVTEDSLTQCVSEIRRALGTEHRSIVKTVAKRGYLFDAEILANAAGRITDRSQSPLVCVLPFANLSDGRVPAYLADGITEDITTALSKWRWLRVIAANTMQSYKGTTKDLRVVAAELQVGYVVTGSIRMHRRRLRITAQVTDAADHEQIWTDQFDGHLDDVFELQDRIARGLAVAIDPALRKTERRRSLFKPTENLDAWDCYLQGSYEFHRYRKDAMARARTMFEQALAIDSHLAQAQARLAGAHGFEAILGWSNNYNSSLDAAHEAANAAISIDELEALGHVALARASLWKGLHDGALEAASASIALNPNLHEAYSLQGQCLTFGGRPLEAIQPFEMAMVLSPRDPLAWATRGLKSLALFLSNQFLDAIHESDRALALRPRYSVARIVKAASLANLRRSKDAERENRLISSSALSNFKNRWPFRREADRTKVLRALAKARSK